MIFNQALLLSVDDRKEEACATWLSHESINPSSFREQLDDLLERSLNQYVHRQSGSNIRSSPLSLTILLQIGASR